MFSFFYVLLTVHLCTILVMNKINAQNFCFIISLLYASTCFEHCCAHHQEVKLYYTGVMIPDALEYNFDLLMMSTTVLETCRGI